MDRLTVGVEEEFFVVDRRGRLSQDGAELVRSADDRDGELQTELTTSQAELATGVCDTHEQLLGQLTDLRTELATAGAGRGLLIVPCGTVLVGPGDALEITPKARYQRMAEHFRATVTQVTACGCHVHVAIPDAGTGVKVINHVRPWLPVLLALTANSPIASGMDTGYASWRYRQWTQWPSAGPPPRFDSPEHYETIVDGWLRAGAVLDRAMVYWDVRLSEHQPTLEFRVSDVAATAAEAVLLTVVIRALTHTAIEAGGPAPRLSNEILRAELWRAARDGLGGEVVDPRTGSLAPAEAVVADLLTSLKPVLQEYGDAEFVEETFARLRASGGGAHRQRLAFARAGRPEDVVDMLAVPPRTAADRRNAG